MTAFPRGSLGSRGSQLSCPCEWLPCWFKAPPPQHTHTHIDTHPRCPQQGARGWKSVWALARAALAMEARESAHSLLLSLCVYRKKACIQCKRVHAFVSVHDYIIHSYLRTFKRFPSVIWKCLDTRWRWTSHARKACAPPTQLQRLFAYLLSPRAGFYTRIFSVMEIFPNVCEWEASDS